MNELSATVFIVDDDLSVRRALARLLKVTGFRPVAFASAEDFLRHPLPDGPACAVLDVSLPGLSGLDLQCALAENAPNLSVLFITGHGDIPMSVRAMKGGAVDFLPKPFDNRALLAAVRQALARGQRAYQEAAEAAALRHQAETLSPREREVLALVVSGMLNKQAASQLGVTEGTIKVHRARVMQKLGAQSLAELVHLAARLGISPARVSAPCTCPGRN
jgi:FixJ family two-component response regulator